MRDSINPDILTNWVSMMRADIDGAILLADDEDEGRFYERCKHGKARIVPSPNVAISLLHNAQRRGVRGVVALVRGHSTTEALPESVFQPELGDVASLLLTSTCISPSLEQIVGPNWMRACEKEIGNLPARAVSLAWLIFRCDLMRNVPSTPDLLNSIIDWEKFDLHTPAIERRDRSPTIDEFNLLKQESRQRSTKELLQECDGLVAMEIVAISTRLYRPRGLQADSQVDSREIMRMLRIAYDPSDLESDHLFWGLREWERRNINFPLLREWRILDPLKAVWDQRYWECDLRAMLDGKFGTDGLMALQLDLDNFKLVNEKLGHSGGDEVIRLACTILRDCVHEVAEIYRRGGDELVALAPGIRGQRAIDLAETIRSRIESGMLTWSMTKGVETSPTASIGMVDADAGSHCADVIRLMDETQGLAKSTGKNRVVPACVGRRTSVPE